MTDPQIGDTNFVPDLIPRGIKIRIVFIGESPGDQEIQANPPTSRSPFVGPSGRRFWEMLADILDEPTPKRNRVDLLKFCTEQEIAVLNSLQHSMPLLSKHYGTNFKNPDDKNAHEKIVERVLDLRKRLKPFSQQSRVTIIALGRIAEKYTKLAMPQASIMYAPHPSSWIGKDKRGQARSLLRKLLQK
ncbi:uracil-DNA glycosylase family protein [Bdellovibrionota bacterium FG-2]